MNTKTMRLPPRRLLTPSKRKDRDEPWPKPITATKLPKQEKPIPRPGSEPMTSPAASGGCKAVVGPMPTNHLLAGYLAHEYLTKGTLMGQPWAPVEKLKGKAEEEDDSSGGEAAATPCRRSAEDEKVKERYAKVAGLLKVGGSHLPGVVNPTQLVRFLHL